MESKQIKSKDKSNEHIQVFVRVRPLNSSETSNKSATVVDTTNKDVVVNERPTDRITKTFSFDKVFGQDSKQIEVYKSVVAPLIEEVLAGYNCTVFAYGQTGTGKTFTMEGDRSSDPSVSWDNDPSSGIIPRTLSHLFDELRIIQAEYTVRVSFLELYNEELFDLLSPTDDTSKLKLYEDVNKKGSVIVHGLEEVPVHNKNEVYKIMEKGSLKRQTASTLMNAKSSRSHTIFSITVHIKENSLEGEELLKTGKLNLVDLAGSENVGRSGAVDKRAREAGNINQSLLTLGRCIKSLVERTPHVPYRESKLTRLLQDSLGGKTKTSIIATISPAGCSLEETLSTLDYAHRAKNITNRPEINQKLTKKFLLREYTEEIDRLRKDLMATREGNGVYLAKENYHQMIEELENLQTEMGEKIANIRALTDEMEKKETILKDLGIDLERRTHELTLTNKLLDKSRQRLHDTKERLLDTRVHLHETKVQLHDTKVQLRGTEQERDEHSHLVERHVETETELGQQAKHLLAVAEESTNDTYRLHDKLQRKLVIEDKNHQVSNAFLNTFNGNIQKLVNNLGEFTQDQLESCKTVQAVCGEHLSSGRDSLIEKRNILSSLGESFARFMLDISANIAGQENAHNNWQISFLAAQKSHTATSCTSIDEFMIKIGALLQMIDNDIGNIEKVVNEEKVSMPLKLADHEESIKKFCKVQLEGFTALQESVVQIVEKNRLEIEASQSLACHLQNKIEKFVANSQLTTQSLLEEATQVHDKMQLNLTTVKASETEIADKVTESTNTNRNYFTLFDSQVGDCVDSISKEVESRVTESSICLANCHKNGEFLKQNLLHEQTVQKDGLMTEMARVERVVQNQAANLAQKLQNQRQLVEETKNGVQLTSEALQVSLQDQEHALENYSSQLQQSMLVQADKLTEWSRTAGVELQARNQEVVKFVNSDLSRDVPTGATPERKGFSYVRVLAATSPHQKIIERFRASRPCIINESFSESDTNTIDSSSDCDQTFSVEEELQSLSEVRCAGIRRSLSTNDIPSLNADNVLNISTISEKEYQHENKENSATNLCVAPAKTMKNGNGSLQNITSKSRVDSGLKKPLMAQNRLQS